MARLYRQQIPLYMSTSLAGMRSQLIHDHMTHCNVALEVFLYWRYTPEHPPRLPNQNNITKPES